MTDQPKAYLTMVDLHTRSGDGPCFHCYDDGIIIPTLKGYTILPQEAYADLLDTAGEHQKAASLRQWIKSQPDHPANQKKGTRHEDQ